MKYLNAKVILPDALVKELQAYVQGGYIYVQEVKVYTQNGFFFTFLEFGIEDGYC